MAAIHRLGVIHFDIKPKNILVVCETESHRPILKLADFGLARQLHGSRTHISADGGWGTLKYMAPEVVHQPSQSFQFRDVLDVWSVGVVLHQLLHGGETPHEYLLRDEGDEQAGDGPPGREGILRAGWKMRLALGIADQRTLRFRTEDVRVDGFWTLTSGGSNDGSSPDPERRRRRFCATLLRDFFLATQEACLTYNYRNRVRAEKLRGEKEELREVLEEVGGAVEGAMVEEVLEGGSSSSLLSKTEKNGGGETVVHFGEDEDHGGCCTAGASTRAADGGASTRASLGAKESASTGMGWREAVRRRPALAALLASVSSSLLRDDRYSDAGGGASVQRRCCSRGPIITVVAIVVVVVLLSVALLIVVPMLLKSTAKDDVDLPTLLKTMPNVSSSEEPREVEDATSPGRVFPSHHPKPHHPKPSATRPPVAPLSGASGVLPSSSPLRRVSSGAVSSSIKPTPPQTAPAVVACLSLPRRRPFCGAAVPLPIVPIPSSDHHPSSTEPEVCSSALPPVFGPVKTPPTHQPVLPAYASHDEVELLPKNGPPALSGDLTTNLTTDSILTNRSPELADGGSAPLTTPSPITTDEDSPRVDEDPSRDWVLPWFSALLCFTASESFPNAILALKKKNSLNKKTMADLLDREVSARGSVWLPLGRAGGLHPPETLLPGSGSVSGGCNSSLGKASFSGEEVFPDLETLQTVGGVSFSYESSGVLSDQDKLYVRSPDLSSRSSGLVPVPGEQPVSIQSLRDMFSSNATVDEKITLVPDERRSGDWVARCLLGSLPVLWMELAADVHVDYVSPTPSVKKVVVRVSALSNTIGEEGSHHTWWSLGLPTPSVKKVAITWTTTSQKNPVVTPSPTTLPARPDGCSALAPSSPGHEGVHEPRGQENWELNEHEGVHEGVHEENFFATWIASLYWEMKALDPGSAEFQEMDLGDAFGGYVREQWSRGRRSGSLTDPDVERIWKLVDGGMIHHLEGAGGANSAIEFRAVKEPAAPPKTGLKPLLFPGEGTLFPAGETGAAVLGTTASTTLSSTESGNGRGFQWTILLKFLDHQGVVEDRPSSGADHFPPLPTLRQIHDEIDRICRQEAAIGCGKRGGRETVHEIRGRMKDKVKLYPKLRELFPPSVHGDPSAGFLAEALVLRISPSPVVRTVRIERFSGGSGGTAKKMLTCRLDLDLGEGRLHGGGTGDDGVQQVVGGKSDSASGLCPWFIESEATVGGLTHAAGLGAPGGRQKLFGFGKSTAGGRVGVGESPF